MTASPAVKVETADQKMNKWLFLKNTKHYKSSCLT